MIFFQCMLLLLPVFARCSSNTGKTERWMPVRGGESDETTTSYRLIQAQVIHRHGDRTPITPLKDEDFWASTLIPPAQLEKISDGTKIVRRHNNANTHAAKGRYPFGLLTQLGLFQMVNLGTTLREQFVSEGELDSKTLWSKEKPLTTRDVRVVCTDFPRTIQSVQGVLVGLFPDGLEETVEIDCSHTSWMIPDPQPRRSSEQEELEVQLASRPHMLEREEEMRPLAVRCTEGLKDTLAPGAFGVSFGVDDTGEGSKKVLPWANLAEITCCLKVRDMLPESITAEDQESLASHLAWRWFESLRHPRLSYLAMHKFAHAITHTLKHHDEEPPLTIYSAHDSTLIGLISVFRLEQPKSWPEYGSFLKIELLEKSNCDNEVEHVVRFFLNGELLRSQWHGDLKEEISLQKLAHFVSIEGATK